MKIQEAGLLAIVITICIAFLGSVLGSALGKPVSADLQGVINSTFVALAVVVPTWLAVNRNEQAKSAARLDGLRAGVMLEKQGVKVVE